MWELESLGFTSEHAAAFEPFAREGCSAGRVAGQHRHLFVVYAPRGEHLAHVAGRLRHTGQPHELPAVGDFVALGPADPGQRASIRAVLARRGSFSRKVAGPTTREQVVAANVDWLWLVCGLDRDFNLRRIERALVLAREGGAQPVIVLNKADVCPDRDARAAAVRALAPGVPAHMVSSLLGEGLDALEPYLAAGRTVVPVGSSGVGKSTLINRLLGSERQATGGLRDDGRGRHTTTRRELIALPGGGWMIDTPGLRELQLWADESAVAGAFDDVETLSARCRFRDCSHTGELGCGVREAVESGSLPSERLESYLKLQRELRQLELRRQDWRSQQDRKKLRALHRHARRFRPRE